MERFVRREGLVGALPVRQAALLGVVALLVLASLGVFLARGHGLPVWADTGGVADPPPPEPSYTLTQDKTVVNEGTAVMFTVTGENLGADPKVFTFSIGPDAASGDASASLDDFGHVYPAVSRSAGNLVGTLTLTSDEASAVVLIEALDTDGVDGRIRETFKFSVTDGADVSLESSAVINEGVCNRGETVCIWIVQQVTIDEELDEEISCWAVTDEHLAALNSRERLLMDMGPLNATGFKSGDLAGVESVFRLDIRNHRMTEMPEGLFDNVRSLGQIWAHKDGDVNKGILPVGDVHTLYQNVTVVAGVTPNTVRLLAKEAAAFELSGDVSVVSGGSLYSGDAAVTKKPLTIAAGERYSDEVHYRAEHVGTMVTFTVGGLAFADGFYNWNFGLRAGPDAILPFDALYIDGLKGVPVDMEEDANFEFELKSLNTLNRVVDVPVRLLVKDSEGNAETGVATLTSGVVRFEANEATGDFTVNVAHNTLDELFDDKEVYLEIEEPRESAFYHIVSGKKRVDLGYVVDGICDRAEPVKAAVLARLSKPYRPVLCHDVTLGDVSGLDGTLKISDSAGEGFEENDFYGLSRLEDVQVDTTNTAVIEREAFAGLDSLVSLRIEGLGEDLGNQMPDGSLLGIPTMRHLRIQGAFSSVPDNFFVGIAELHALIVVGVGTIDVPLTVYRDPASWSNHYEVRVPTAAPFPMVFQLISGEEVHSSRIEAGQTSSAPVLFSPTVDNVGLNHWYAPTGAVHDGIRFRYPHYMDMIDEDELGEEETIYQASLSYTSYDDDGFTFRVTLDEEATTDVVVRYEYGLEREVVDFLSDLVLAGEGDVTVASGQTYAEFYVELDWMEYASGLDSHVFGVMLAAPMDSENYSIDEDASSVELGIAPGLPPVVR